MATFDKSKMSADEWQFIRTYCLTIQREYHLLQIISGLMSPKWLHIKCAADATEKAKKLYAMQAEFCKKIEQFGEKKSNTRADTVTPDMIANIFVTSFFKLVDSETKQVFITNKGLPAHDGWSSGHPADWQQTIHSLQELHEQNMSIGNTKHGALFGIIFNLFLSGSKYKKPPDPQEMTDPTFDVPPNYPQDEEEDYDEEYEDEDYDDDSDYDDDISSFM